MSSRSAGLRARPGAAVILGVSTILVAVPTPSQVPVTVRGKTLSLRVQGPPDGPPVLVSSGDGGWVHLGPEVATFLAAQGYFVIGLDAKAYLSAFTEGKKTLTAEDVPGDYRVFVDQARRGRDAKVLLVGVSEGAGLSVLAAAGEPLGAALAGVLGLGLPNVNELGWRFRDQIIYITHKPPSEPSFKATDYVSRLGSLPLAAIHSTHDEFVPLDEVKAVMEQAGGGPRRLFIIDAQNHRFSDKQPELQQRVLEALSWIKAGGK